MTNPRSIGPLEHQCAMLATQQLERENLHPPQQERSRSRSRSGRSHEQRGGRWRVVARARKRDASFSAVRRSSQHVGNSGPTPLHKTEPSIRALREQGRACDGAQKNEPAHTSDTMSMRRTVPVGGLPEELLGAEVGVAEQPTGRHVGVEATAGALHAVRGGVRPGRLVAPQAADLFFYATSGGTRARGETRERPARNTAARQNL